MNLTHTKSGAHDSCFLENVKIETEKSGAKARFAALFLDTARDCPPTRHLWEIQGFPRMPYWHPEKSIINAAREASLANPGSQKGNRNSETGKGGPAHAGGTEGERAFV